ncbi:MAG TPA: histidinol-phosphate transaminase [Candidatus Acidoferrales bacterium]|nr:histidinol-phosphate transaminase [Candidatus Acidoferrales bacterium]
MPIDPLLRASAHEFSPYKPGTSVAQARERYGLEHFVKLSQNENPLGTSPRAVAAVAAISGYSDYFEDDHLALRERLANLRGLTSDYVILGHGSNELLSIAFSAFVDPGEDVVMAKPTFALYRKDADIAGAHAIEVPLRDGVHDLPAMLAAVTPRTKLVFVCDPNNPTGTRVQREDFARFAEALPSHVLLVVDQAYIEFADAQSTDASALMKWHARTLSLRTASKIYGLASIRFGYGYAPPEIITWMNRVRVPYNVARPAAAAVNAALDDEDFIRRSIENNERGKAFLYAEFERLGLHAYPTAANFVALEVPCEAGVAYEGLLSKGVIVRSGDGLNMPRRIRVTIGKPQENQAFIAALEPLLAQWRSRVGAAH